MKDWGGKGKIGSNEAVGECLKGWHVDDRWTINWYDDRCDSWWLSFWRVNDEGSEDFYASNNNRWDKIKSICCYLKI